MGLTRVSSIVGIDDVDMPAVRQELLSYLDELRAEVEAGNLITLGVVSKFRDGRSQINYCGFDEDALATVGLVELLKSQVIVDQLTALKSLTSPGQSQ